MDASDSQEAIVSILDGILLCITKDISEDNDQIQENTLMMTTSGEIGEKQCTYTGSISAKEQEEQDTAVDIPGEVTTAVDADTSTNYEKGLKEEFIKAIDLNVSPMKNSKDNTGECVHNAKRTEQLKKESVHFCSPIASFHEYYVSQDSCTQSLSDIDELTPESSESDFDVKQEKEQCKDKDDHISGNLASLMTPAGDCTNTLVVGCSMSEMNLIHDHDDAKTLLITENSKDTVKYVINDASNKAGEVLLLGATTKDAILLKNEESGTDICETVKKETDSDKGLPCANSSPDLFDNCTTDSSVSNIVTEHDNTQKQSEKTPSEEHSQDSTDVKIETGVKDADTEYLTEQMEETLRFKNTCKKEDLKTTQDVKQCNIPSNITDNNSSTDKRCLGNEAQQGAEISKISYLDIDSEQQKIGGNKLCYEMTNDSSQDLFQDVENGADIMQQCNSDEKALQLTPDLFCNESLDMEFESNNNKNCSNKREISSPDSDIQPSKKQKMDSYTEIQEKMPLKRIAHFVEENVTEILSSPKKIRLSTDDENETPCALIPKALKLLAAENLECLKEEELWSRNTDQKSKGSTSVFQTEATLSLSELGKQCGIPMGSGKKSGDQCVVPEEVHESECTFIEIKELEHHEMDDIVNNIVTQNENVLTEGVQAVDQDDIGADTLKKVSQSSTEQCDEVKVITPSHAMITEDSIDMCQNDKTETENTDGEKSIDHDNENKELIENVSDENVLSETLSVNLGNKETKIEDVNIDMTQTDETEPDLKGTEDASSLLIDTNKIDSSDFVSATEYLSQSSQGSSTGFTYDKNLSPELLCGSQGFRSLSGYMTEEGYVDGISNDGPDTGDADHFSQPTLITVELAAEPSKESEVDIETLDIMVSHAVDHLVPDDDVAATEDADNPEGYSMFGKSEDKKSKFYSCDMDICDEEDKPMCSPVDKRGDTDVPSSSTSCFKWRYAPSCDTDLSPVAELEPEDTIVRITPIIHTCNKPLRLGLSKKRKPLHRLHKF